MYHSTFKTYTQYCTFNFVLVIFLGLLLVPFIEANVGVNFAEIADRHRRAVDENPMSPQAHLNLGCVYLAVAAMEQAEGAFENAIQLAPKDNAGYYWLGGTYFLQEKYEQSIDVFQRALQKFPDWRKAYAALGLSHFRRHNHEAAEIAFTKALTLTQSPHAPKNSVNPSPFALETNVWDSRMNAMSPARICYFLGLIAFQRGDISKAAEHWQRAIALDPATTEAYFQLGVAFVKEKQWEAGESALRQAIRLNPQMSEAHYQLAQLYFKQGKSARAATEMSAFEQLKAKSVHRQTKRDAFKQTSSAAAIFLDLARQCVRENKYNDAVLQFQKALWHNPNFAAAYNGLGYVYTMQRQFKKALKAQQKAIEFKPHMAAAHVGLGLIWLKQAEISGSDEDYVRALTAYRKALELKPDFPEALLNLGSIAFKLSRFEQAATAYEQLLSLQPDRTRVRRILANIYFREGKFRQARRHYQETLKKDPDFAEAHYFLGIIALQEHSLDEAVERLSTAVEVQPNIADAHYYLGNIYFEQKRYSLAEAAYRRAIAVQPSSANAYERLAHLYGSQGIHLDQAVMLAQKSVKLRPGIAANFNTLSWIYYLKKDYINAESSVKKALTLEPENAVFLEGLKAIQQTMKNEK